MLGYRFGSGGTRISLIGGCHADEPVGPRFLRRLVAFLAGLSTDHALLEGREWWVVPQANPDGESRNRSWQNGDPDLYDLPAYLEHVVRELPGDDMEFGFPRGPNDHDARPEPRAIRRWWGRAPGPFSLHASLHGMAFAGGAWFLVDSGWVDRIRPLEVRLRRKAVEVGLPLHDVERRGEKGFVRLGPGFATRPDSRAMRSHFAALGDLDTAGRFRPSSMETIRSLGGDPLTLVSELPLFLTPGVGEDLGPPDPLAERWKERVSGWRTALLAEMDPDGIRREAVEKGLRAVPVPTQMDLQWELIRAGLALVEGKAEPS